MTPKSISPQERKLNNIRKILWIVFAGVTIPLLISGLFAIPVVNMLTVDPSFSPPPGMSTGFLLLSMALGLVIMIGIVAVICLVIYYIFKYRLEKDEEFFL